MSSYYLCTKCFKPCDVKPAHPLRHVVNEPLSVCCKAPVKVRST